MKKFSYMDLAALAVWLLPAVYLFFIYASLPQTVPMHYGLDGKVNRYGSKSEFLMFQWLMMGMPALVYLLLKFLPAIDPKNKVKYGERTFQKLGLGLVVFFSALNGGILFATVHRDFQLGEFIFPVIGLLFAFLGNMMNNIKPNYFAGIRTPWTLENEDNWRATHRLAARIWFPGGILLTALMFILPQSVAPIVFICTIVTMALIPVIYSYVYFKRNPLKG